MNQVDQSVSRDAGGDDEDMSAIDWLLTLAERWKLLVFMPLLVGVLALGYSFTIRPVFTASARLLTPQEPMSTATAMAGAVGGGGVALGGLGALAGLKNPADKWVGLLGSRTIADALVERFKLQEQYKTPYRFLAWQELANRTRITTGKDSLIDIEVDDEDPEAAARLVSGYVEELQKLALTLAVKEGADRRQFFGQRLADAKAGLTKAEVGLKQVGIRADVVKTQPEFAVAKLAQLQAIVAALETKVAVMRGAMTDNNPEFRIALLELSALRDQFKRAERDQPGGDNGSGSEYIERYRDFKYYETLFEQFARQYEAARADEARTGVTVQIVDPVLVPEYKSSPKRGRIAMLSTLVALGVCLAYVVAKHRWHSYRQTPEGDHKAQALKRALQWRRR